jgi:hypothetical protein
MKTTITLPRLQPRNPFAQAARMRQAGTHRSGNGALRQRARRELQRDLDCMKPPSP